MKIIRAGLSLMLALSAYGQGPLLPPGAPGPTMKTLAQVEPRTAITNAPVTISQPGSYYLATNVAGTITLDADHVTLDLMGFRVAASSGSGIVIPTGKGKHTVVRNGVIRMATAAYGVDGRYIQDGNSRFENLLIDGNDVAWCGLSIGSGCLIRDCDIRNCNNNGIIGNSTYGGLEVRDCRITGGTLDGVTVYKNSRVVDNLIEGNEDAGLVLVGTGTFVAGNLVRANGDNYDLAAGNQLNLLLDQIPESLDWPCSVKLAGTLICAFAASNGITVNSDNVTIDLAGHALVGPGATSGHGIYQASTYRNLAVLNGKIVNWRGESKGGVYADGYGNRFAGVQAATNYFGLYANRGSALSDCTACDSAPSPAAGIKTGNGCTLTDCVAYDNHGVGIFAGVGSTLNGCVAYGNDLDGFHLDGGNTLNSCTARYNSNDGIFADSGSVLSDCAALFNDGDGFEVTTYMQVIGCVAHGNGNGSYGVGIRVTGTDNRIEGNTLTVNDRGIEVVSAGNLIVRNSASNNTTNWTIAVNNKVGPIVSAPNSAAINGDTGGAGVGSTDPWANITF